MMDEPRLLLDKRQAAYQLSISLQQLDLMIATGGIPAMRIGRRVLVNGPPRGRETDDSEQLTEQ